MARVPLIEETEHPELAESIAKIKGARGGRLINIYRLMLHSPALANAWFDLDICRCTSWNHQLLTPIKILWHDGKRLRQLPAIHA